MQLAWISENCFLCQSPRHRRFVSCATNQDEEKFLSCATTEMTVSNPKKLIIIPIDFLTIPQYFCSYYGWWHTKYSSCCCCHGSWHTKHSFFSTAFPFPFFWNFCHMKWIWSRHYHKWKNLYEFSRICFVCHEPRPRFTGWFSILTRPKKSLQVSR